MTDWLKEALEIEPELIELRHTLHRRPEEGNHEFFTSDLLVSELEKCGVEIRRMMETAAVGILRGAYPGPTAALRTDMDALPVKEETGLPFSSENEGLMHACGHDIHMTALIGAARLLAKHRDEMHGNVVFLLQPAEENIGGAERMIHNGALEGVDAVFGAHCNPALKAGTIGIKYGIFYAASTRFNVTVHGKGCHGAEPENGIDPLYAACRMCTKLKELTGVHNGLRDVVSVGLIRAGKARNIIPDEAYFMGILRTKGFANRDMMTQKIIDTIMEIEEETGVYCEIEVFYAYPGVINHDEETALAEKAAKKVLSAENVKVMEEGTMTSEDFGYFLLERPGSFYHIGVESEAGLHSPRFNPDESAIAKAAAVHAAVLTEYLEEHKEK
ncbi:MAG: M20 family metallopeptidase [Erysipelotrichaceae bacterium]|nr:M20 family metallopeptidase [Erysipelotrichaceae bacterium]